jgi:hypothetical protein
MSVHKIMSIYQPILTMYVYKSNPETETEASHSNAGVWNAKPRDAMPVGSTVKVSINTSAGKNWVSKISRL